MENETIDKRLKENFLTWSGYLHNYYFAIFAFLTGSGFFGYLQNTISPIVRSGIELSLMGIFIGLLALYSYFAFDRICIFKAKHKPFKLIEGLLIFLIFLSFIFTVVGVYRTAYSFTSDKNCVDFKTQLEAQRYFESNGGGKNNNFNDLDRDHDGVACKDLPKN